MYTHTDVRMCGAGTLERRAALKLMLTGDYSSEALCRKKLGHSCAPGAL